jgi:hypothetical protein
LPETETVHVRFPANARRWKKWKSILAMS